MIKDGCKKCIFFNPFNLSFKKLINLTSTKKKLKWGVDHIMLAKMIGTPLLNIFLLEEFSYN